MPKDSLKIVLKISIKCVVLLVLWATCSIDGQTTVSTTPTYTCPANFQKLLNAADEKRSICWRNASDDLPFYAARLQCRKLGGYLLYMEDKEEADFLNQPASKTALQIPHRFWIGVWRKNGKLIWDVTGKEIKENGFQLMNRWTQQSDYTCVYRNGHDHKSAGNLNYWANTPCNSARRTYCRARFREEPGIPMISFTPSYPGAGLGDFQKGENVSITCEAVKGDWGDLVITILPLEQDPQSAALTYTQGQESTEYRFTNNSLASLTVEITPVDTIVGRVIMCASDYEVNKDKECVAGDTHCAVLGKIELQPPVTPNTTTTVAPPEGEPESWWTLTRRDQFLSLAAGFIVGLIIGVITLEMYLRRRLAPMVSKSLGGEGEAAPRQADEGLHQAAVGAVGRQSQASEKWDTDYIANTTTPSGVTRSSRPSQK